MPARDIIADPKRIAAAHPDFAEARWAFLADLLDITPEELRRTIQDNSDKEFLFLKKSRPCHCRGRVTAASAGHKSEIQ